MKNSLQIYDDIKQRIELFEELRSTEYYIEHIFNQNRDVLAHSLASRIAKRIFILCLDFKEGHFVHIRNNLALCSDLYRCRKLSPRGKKFKKEVEELIDDIRRIKKLAEQKFPVVKE